MKSHNIWCLYFVFSVYILYNIKDRSQVFQAIAELRMSELKNERANTRTRLQ